MITVTLQIPEAFKDYMRSTVPIAAGYPIGAEDVHQFATGIFAAYLDAVHWHALATEFEALNDLNAAKDA